MDLYDGAELVFTGSRECECIGNFVSCRYNSAGRLLMLVLKVYIILCLLKAGKHDYNRWVYPLKKGEAEDEHSLNDDQKASSQRFVRLLAT